MDYNAQQPLRRRFGLRYLASWVGRPGLGFCGILCATIFPSQSHPTQQCGSQTCSCSHLPSVFKGVDIVSSASLGMGIIGVQEKFFRVVGPILLRLLLLFDQALCLMCAT